MAQLALLGGEALRKKPFLAPLILDGEEERLILEVVRSGEFSRFMGSPAADIDVQLAMPSAQARDYQSQYFMFLGGKMVRRFEADFAAMFGVKYAMTVNSATSGLSTALGACGIGPGDEVITTCLSFNATALSILLFNSIPVFCDVDVRNFCIDPDDIERKITAKTKAILVVHLLGNAADMDRIMAIARKHDLKVIEDCAQAPGVTYKGRKVGTIGHAGVFSFQETKNISTGEGGMIVTDDAAIARKCRLIRNHGESIPQDNSSDEELMNVVGFNFRMTELTAAMGIAQLKKLASNNRGRNENAACLAQSLSGLRGLRIPRNGVADGSVSHVFPMFYDKNETGVDRSVVVSALRAEGIPVGTGYQKLMPDNPLFLKKIAYGNKGCPFTCPLHGRDISYEGAFPVARDLIQDRFVWFYHVNPPNSPQDMGEVAGAFSKVWQGLEALKEYKPLQVQKFYKW